MTARVAPWLEGLSEAWEAPQKTVTTDHISSASHDASSLQSSKSRIPRPSVNGHPSTFSRQHTTSRQNTQRTRDPLAPLSSNDANSVRRHNSTNKLAGTRSVSEASNKSLLACGTVQYRSKSASPAKKKETLEWKKRLVHGELGYGDQTDLFGPSGLENIFARSKGPENQMPKTKQRMGWLQKSHAPMPSSPPPWPSCFVDDSQDQDTDVSNPHLEGQPPMNDSEAFFDDNASFRSDPFDLETSVAPPPNLHRSSSNASLLRSSPEKAFIDPAQNDIAQNRTASGQTELEQEDFSPVFVSKHKTVSGQVDYTALDSHLVKQLQSDNVRLRHPSQPHSHHSAIQSGYQAEVSDPRSDSPGVPADSSFSENLPTGSPMLNVDTNVQVKSEASLQTGSFQHRAFSPSPSRIQHSMISDASELLSTLPPPEERPSAPTPPQAPTTPLPVDEPTARSSGSPLKLFGAYDTFTNNRLLRRMSELNPDGTLRSRGLDAIRKDEHQSRQVSTGSSFGNGDLDNHTFNAEITVTSASDSNNDDSDRSPGSEIPPPGSKSPLAFRFEVPSDVKDTFKMKRKRSKQSGAASKGSTLENQVKLASVPHPTVDDVSEAQLEIGSANEQDRQYGPGKRPPTSPFKNPTPKRIRTLHASEIESGVATMNDSYHSQLQEAISSRKRKDARQGEVQNMADPEVLSQRKILRPRNPTPTQRRRQQIEAELKEAVDEFAEQKPERLEAVMEQIESSMASDAEQTLEEQAPTLASEVAAFTLRVQKPSGEQVERKGSVTTQDFLNEAMMVMNLIRAKARPQSNLGSVEESEAEIFRQSLQLDDDPEEESLLRVSRPPSREGSGWRMRAPVHTDARVISHLRKFEEKEDIDDTNFIANSIASLQVDDDEHLNDQVVVVDEHANVRITGPLTHRNQDKGESGSNPASQRSQGSNFNTHGSDGTSTGRTIETVSTRKSDNVGTLAPGVVAHLIGDQVGGMTFDKDQQRWVRISKSPEKAQGSFLELPSTVTSDDDPFREISDLPVDEQKELRRLSSSGKNLNEQSVDGKSTSGDENAQEKKDRTAREPWTASQETAVLRPVTRDSTHIQPNHSSSVPSRYTAFASSQQQEKVETRATSWSDEELAKMSALGRARQQPLMHAAAQAAIAVPTSDAKITGPPAQDQAKVAFPSPPSRELPKNAASCDHSPPAKIDEVDENIDGLSCIHNESAALEAERINVEDTGSPKARQTPSKPPLPPRSAYRANVREPSLRRKTLVNAVDGETQEQSELSIVAPLPGDRIMSLSLSVSRPMSKRLQPRKVTELQSSPSKGNLSFILSDLPDFTIHEEDEERSSERVLATRLAHHAAAEVNDRYALAVKGLVKILTDVNEDEPYWEDLKELDLHDRCLVSLYGLEDFCSNIQDMDVSSNTLLHLTGAPATLRRLDATFNQLSGLTSWDHLTNLQYLDISNNHLEDLNGLNRLIHLRELRADDNRIASMNGIFELDGLLKLRLRRNKLKHVDFSNFQLQRLENLDLCNNEVATLEHLDALCSLTELRLEGNNLAQGLHVAGHLPQLSYLSAKGCNLDELDVSWCPNLRYLNIDDNRMCNIKSINTLKSLDVLSMRRQTLPDQSSISIFDQLFEASTIYLSENKIPEIRISGSFLNIRHLELASVGLQALPDDFGLRMPNVRCLNLNFNSITDIRPLLNIQRLEQLSVSGNRLHKLRKSIATFEKMKYLRTLDLRDNPLTQGFYASLASTMSKHTSLMCRFGASAKAEEDKEVSGVEKARHEFPAGQLGADRQHRARLDEGTELRRRVYEVLLAQTCRELVRVDGLEFERSEALQQDAVWYRLIELGVLKKSQDSVVELME